MPTEYMAGADGGMLLGSGKLGIEQKH
jgi:hypothetical protein